MDWSFDSSESIVNSRCPISGSLIDPAKMANRLTRHWNGQVIGFASAASAAIWDGLSDGQKMDRLNKVMEHHVAWDPAAQSHLEHDSSRP